MILFEARGASGQHSLGVSAASFSNCLGYQVPYLGWTIRSVSHWVNLS